MNVITLCSFIRRNLRDSTTPTIDIKSVLEKVGFSIRQITKMFDSNKQVVADIPNLFSVSTTIQYHDATKKRICYLYLIFFINEIKGLRN